ncbi:COG1361 family protein [Phytohabitans suffuscus]|nr:peptidase [Phytohabitans suffuscus]
MCAAGSPASGAHAAPAALSPPDGGSFGIQLLDAPSNRRDDPRAHRYIVDHLPPGEAIQRRVRVVNNSPDKLRMEVYPAAATVDKSGFRFLPGEATNELTSWMSIQPATLTLDAGQEATPTVTIRVPPRASAGERYAVIWASVSSKPVADGTVRQVNRAGVRVYLDIGPGGDPPADFSIGPVTPRRGKDGSPSVHITVDNTGQRALDISGDLSLSDGPAGARAGPFKVGNGTTVAVGGSRTIAVPLPRNLPDGHWTLKVELRSGQVTRTASGRVTFPKPGQSGIGAFFSGEHTTRTLIAGSVAVPLLVLAGLALIARRSRLRNSQTG